MHDPNVNMHALMEQKLHTLIQNGRRTAGALFEKIHEEIPQDSIARGAHLTFKFEAEKKPALAGVESLIDASLQATEQARVKHGVKVRYGKYENWIHRHALGQLAEKAGLPSKHLADWSNNGGWQGELAAHVLNEHYSRDGELVKEKYLLRAVRGQVRGVLSSRYRRLDNRPLIEAFAEECQKVGAEPIDGTGSDTRVAMKAIIPRVFEPVPGEVLTFGVEWSNSDYGSAKHAIRVFLFRLWCSNGATMENALGQVHLGREMGESIELSDKTYRLDTEASISALQDVVRSVFKKEQLDAMSLRIRKAHEEKVDWKSIDSKVGKRLLKDEAKAVKEAFEGEDVLNLPAGPSYWRASNALSWIANKAEPDRKLDLQRLAGEILPGSMKDAA